MKIGRQTVGHPIDVATGIVTSNHVDVSIPGKVELTWERLYSTGNLGTSTPLGPGWTTRYFATLTHVEGEFRFAPPEGGVDVFADPENTLARGGIIRNLGSFQEISKKDNRYIVTRWDVEGGEIECFVFLEGPKDRTWPLASIENMTGQGLDMLWDNTGRLTGVRQRLEKRTLALDYTKTDRIQAVSLLLPGDRRQVLVRYDHDDNGRLVTAYDALGCTDRYEYDSAPRMTREIMKDGGVFYFKYDQKGRCIRTSGLDRYDEKSLRFLEAIRWTEVTDSLGHVNRYQLLESGQVITEIDPLGRTRKTEYDEHGRIVARIKPTGAVTRYVYDERGNRCRTINALEKAYILVFNNHHQTISITDPAGQIWRREYDSQHRLIATTDPSGGRWSLRYDSDGNMISFSNPKGATRRFGYRDGVPTEHSDWIGNVSRVELDLLGRLTMRIDPLGHAFRYHYDANGNLIQFGLPDGRSFEVAYDSGGNIRRFADAVGRVTTYRYGTCQRLFETIDANGQRISYSWGTEPGQLDRVVNQRGEIYRFAYNEAGQCVEEIGFDGRRLGFRYDSAGRCAEISNGAGETTLVERDLLDQIVGKKLSDGQEILYVYDPVGNLIEAVNPDCRIRMERDANGRLLREIQATAHGKHWIQYTRDALGDTVRMETDLGLRVGYEMDANRQLSSLRTAEGYVMQFRYDARGGEIQRLFAGGLALDQRYDPVGRLVEQRLGRYAVSSLQREPTGRADLVGDSLLRRRYLRDASGLVSSITDQLSGIAQFTYDPTKQLLKVVRDRGPIERFEYDIAGSLKRIATDGLGGAEDEILTYGPGSRLSSKGRTRYEHDNQGRLVRKIEDADSPQPKIWNYVWDALDQLKTVTRPDGQIWSYKYDAFQRRILKSGPASDVAFVWAGDLPVHEFQLTSNEWTGWLFQRRSFSVLGMVKGDSYSSVVSDHLGTPQELVSTSGRVLPLQKTLSYGKPLSLPASVGLCPFRFQGQYYDSESGLHYSRFRYYEPETGSFISQDPIRLLGDVDLYRYSSDPVNEIDPYGLNTSSDSQQLGRNLTEGGESPRTPGDEDAHHIVMSNSEDPRMVRLRDVMQTHDIDINDPANGVWLPRNADARANGDPRTLHKGEGLHSADYKQSVYDALMAGEPQPPTRRQFLARLRNLKNQLKSGRTFQCRR